MIAQSQSGTGKTATFVLTMLSRINPEEQNPQVSGYYVAQPAEAVDHILR